MNESANPSVEKNFLEKVSNQFNTNHNYVTNKSLGRDNKIGIENKVKLLEPQYEHELQEKAISRTDIIKRHLYESGIKNESIQRKSVRSNQFVTLDQRQRVDDLQIDTANKRADQLFEARKKLYSSVQGVNLPKINMKRGVEEQPPMRKSASYASKPSGNEFIHIYSS